MITIRVVHKLSLHDSGFFDHLRPCVYIFYGMNVDKKWTILDHLPTSYFKRSLWTAPKINFIDPWRINAKDK